MLLPRKSGPAPVCASDPFADPATDPCNPEGYIPSNLLTTIALGLYVLVALAHTYNIIRRGARWMAAMVIGAWTFSAGLSLRYILHSQPDNKDVYIAEYLLIVLSPCAFIAANYVILGHLATHLSASPLLPIPPSRTPLLFVSSDILTFLIQALGGTLSITANSPSESKLGTNIFLVGLVMQLVSFGVFGGLIGVFVGRVWMASRRGGGGNGGGKGVAGIWRRDEVRGLSWYDDWRALVCALAVSCVFIFIRCTYRVIESTQGYKGPLSTNEDLMYLLDTLPLFIAIGVYVPFWPGRFINDKNAKSYANGGYGGDGEGFVVQQNGMGMGMGVGLKPYAPIDNVSVERFK